jgi:nucleotide-binding universal stress UspA family protein
MTEHHVLTVGVDGSEVSSAALEWAAREADRRGASLRVVNSYTVPVYSDYAGASMYPAVDLEALHAECVKAVNLQVSFIRKAYPNVVIDVHVESGWPTSMLIDNAKDADMVITGSHGTGSLSALFLGSVAHHVAHKAPCAAVLVPSRLIATSVRRIVVGTDGSQAAAVALDWARHEAALWGAKLTVVHAWDYPYLDVGVPPQMKTEAERVLSAAEASLKLPGSTPVLVEAKLLTGAPAAVLIDEAADADLLVVGARGRGALRAIILGSTSSYAIQHAKCPVVVVHATNKR